MRLASHQCYKLEFRWTNTEYIVACVSFEDTENVKHLGNHVEKELNWSTHALETLKKSYIILFCPRQIIACNVKTKFKLGLHLLLLLPIVICQTAKLSKSIKNALEKAQKKAVKRIMAKQTSYANNSRLKNTLPLPKFLKMNDLLPFLSVTKEKPSKRSDYPCQNNMQRTLTHEISIKILRTERNQSVFIFTEFEIVNETKKCFEIGNGNGLKVKRLCEMCMHFNSQFDKKTFVIGNRLATVDDSGTYDKNGEKNGNNPSANAKNPHQQSEQQSPRLSDFFFTCICQFKLWMLHGLSFLQNCLWMSSSCL